MRWTIYPARPLPGNILHLARAMAVLVAASPPGPGRRPGTGRQENAVRAGKHRDHIGYQRGERHFAYCRPCERRRPAIADEWDGS